MISWGNFVLASRNVLKCWCACQESIQVRLRDYGRREFLFRPYLLDNNIARQDTEPIPRPGRWRFRHWLPSRCAHRVGYRFCGGKSTDTSAQCVLSCAGIWSGKLLVLSSCP